MKLVRARVTNYRSVENSEEFEIGDLTCLVGKNEAGKTALLTALRGLAPTHTFVYDKIRDYPRRFASKYDERHPDGYAEVLHTWWDLSDEDVVAVEKVFGKGAMSGRVAEVSCGFGAKTNFWDGLQVEEQKCLNELVSAHALDAPERNILNGITDGGKALAALTAATQRTSKQEALLTALKVNREGRFTLGVIDLLKKRMPKFFYTSHFERMSGEIALTELKKQIAADDVGPGDQIFLDFLAYAGTSIDELEASGKREELKSLCEAAGNDITEEIFQFWSQNDSLEVKIDFDEAKAGDKAPFNTGTIAQIRIRNSNHKATLPLSERSAGFVWFFSFLAQFRQLNKTAGNAVVLLDEPSLTLHGRAQGDLLRYMMERLIPTHQVIFSTHSPFMVPAGRLADVRIVEDVIENDKGRKIVKGTKVRADVLRVDRDTLFPLQGALGYEITQSLFIGKNTLLVEGASDIVYLQAVSAALRKRGRVGVSSEWTLCPSGGMDKIAPFVNLFSSNDLNVAVLSDVAKGDIGKIQRLRESQILKAGKFYTVADFLSQAEADIEDLFDRRLYVKLLNATYGLTGTVEINVAKLDAADPSVRQVKKAETLFRLLPPSVKEFNHYESADWLLRNPTFLDGAEEEIEFTLERFEQVAKMFNTLL